MVGDIVVDEASRTASLPEDAEVDKEFIVIRGLWKQSFVDSRSDRWKGWYSRLVDNGL